MHLIEAFVGTTEEVGGRTPGQAGVSGSRISAGMNRSARGRVESKGRPRVECKGLPGGGV